MGSATTAKIQIFFARLRRVFAKSSLPCLSRVLSLSVTNDILERFAWSFVVSLKCVCYTQTEDPVANRETHI